MVIKHKANILLFKILPILFTIFFKERPKANKGNTSNDIWTLNNKQAPLLTKYKPNIENTKEIIIVIINEYFFCSFLKILLEK